MKAYITTSYGSPDVLKQVQTDIPSPKADEILIKNYATTINSADSRLRRADPWLVRLMLGFFKPKIPVSGIVFSGSIVENGQETRRVCGMNFKTFGAFGQYLTTPKSSDWAFLPDNVSFEDGASVLFGGHTVLYFLRKAKIKKGDKVLIYGASGSVGVSAIQLAKYFGAEVTAVCSTKNMDKMKQIGADQVVDYTQTDIKTLTQKYDIVYDTVGKTSEMVLASLVKPKGTLILGSAIIKGAIMGLVAKYAKKIDVVIGTAETNKEDLKFLIDLFDRGVLFPVIDKIYSFEDMAEAHKYVDTGHKVGNVVVRIDNKN